jgi:hypothetical protein
VFGRAVHGERLMRALVIVAFEEAVELRLLLDEVRRRRPGGLQLQDEVHAFVAPVLLRMAWLDPLDLDGESQPPHRQAEIMMRFASEFGFTPASRCRIATPQEREPSLFDGFEDASDERFHSRAEHGPSDREDDTRLTNQWSAGAWQRLTVDNRGRHSSLIGATTSRHCRCADSEGSSAFWPS